MLSRFKSYRDRMARAPRQVGAHSSHQILETRDEFILRLRAAVAWVNKNRAAYLRDLCNSQKTRAQDVIDARGARTKH